MWKVYRRPYYIWFKVCSKAVWNSIAPYYVVYTRDIVFKFQTNPGGRICAVFKCFSYTFLHSYHNQRQSTQQKCSQGLWIFLLILFLKLNKTDCLYRNWSCRQYGFCLYINGYKNRDRDIELDSYLTPKYGRHFIVWHINISVMQNQNNIYYIYLRI